MTGSGNIAKTKQDCSWVKYVFSLMPEKIIKLCSASRMTFRAWIYRTDPQNIGEQFGTLSGFWETLFESERAKESPKMYFRPKSFRTIFEKRAPVYPLAAPLLGMAKSIYNIIICTASLQRYSASTDFYLKHGSCADSRQDFQNNKQLSIDQSGFKWWLGSCKI